MQRKPSTIAFWTGRLPHWEVEDGRYFITLHLAGAIPLSGRTRLRLLAQQLRDSVDRYSPQWLQTQRRIFIEMEHWLDRAEWNPLLQRQDIVTMVAAAIEHRCERREWEVFEYVLMPTHLHLFCAFGDRGMKDVMEDFKRWTAHRATELLSDQRSRPADGTYRFWQREWFDHLLRSDEEDDLIIAYIRNNPVKANLVKQSTDWPHASWSHK